MTDGSRIEARRPRRPTAAWGGRLLSSAALLSTALLVVVLQPAHAFVPPCPSLPGRRAGAGVAAGARSHVGLPTSRSLLPSTVSRSAPRQRGAGSQQLAMMATQKPQDKGGKAKAGANGAAEVGIFHPEHPYRDALVKTALSVGAALLFGLGVWQFKGAESALEYYSGYLVEQSLSVDNLFVFVVLFEYFKVPTDYQGRVLSWGILGAMGMRALMVLAGVEAIENFRAVLLGFAAILIFTSGKLLLEDEEGDGEEDLADNAIVNAARSMITTVDYYDGNKFFTYADGVRVATPLLLVLICVELSDVVFAVDSVPAVFGVTKDPFVVYTSNIFAILGLRSLYTVLANAVVDLPYLKPAVALILGLVGAKLGAEYFGYEVSNALSLGVITSLLGAGVGASLYYRPNPDQ